MLKRIALHLGLALTVFSVQAVVDAPTAVAKKKRSKKAKKSKKKAKKAKKAEQAADEPRDEAQELLENRKAPAAFKWTDRGDKQDMDVRAAQARDESIEKLKKLLTRVGDGPNKAELIFRLSELYWSKSKYLQLRAMKAWDEALGEWDKAGQKGPEPKLEKLPEHSEAELFKREALKLYEKILADYPDYGRKDEVLYNLGSSLYDAGKKREGVRRFWELIKHAPNSDFAADAWLDLGEHFFNENKVNQAMKAYKHAAESKKPRIYSFAIYKLGWCDFNIGEYRSALDRFRNVVEYSKKQAAKKEMEDRDRVQLMEEALADMVRAYSHLDAVDEAFEYYTQEVGKDKAHRYLRGLAKLYNKEGKHDLEVAAYRELNNRYPYHETAAENQAAIMNAFVAANRKDMVRKEVRRLVDLYAPNGTWAKKNADRERVLAKAFEVVEESLSGLATEQHAEAQETGLVGTYKLARDVYKEYLDKFPDGLNAYNFAFYYANILFELKEFDTAAPAYDAVVARDIKGKHAKDSAYNAILSWEKVLGGQTEVLDDKKKISEKKGRRNEALRKLEKLQSLEKGKEYAATELKPLEKKLAAACDRFVQVAPDDSEVVNSKFKSARLYYLHNQFEEAANRFGEIIDRWPNHKLARISAESIVQSFNVRSDWVNLNQWARKFSDNKKLMGDKEFAQTIRDFVEGASFNEIHFVKEPKAQPKEIAELYRGFVKEFPQSKYALVALFNTIVNYDKANLLEESIADAERVLGEYKSFQLKKEDIEKSKKDGSALPKPEDIREKVLFMAANFYERIAEFDKSADLYEQYTNEFPKGPKYVDALFNAGLFREGLGEFDKAIANFRAYNKTKPKDEAAIEWRIGLILEKKEDHKAALKHFDAYARSSRRSDPAQMVCADYHVLLAQKKLGDTKAVAAGYGNIIDKYKKLSDEDKAKPCPLNAMGEAAFNLVEPDFQAYLDLSLAKTNPRKLGDVVQKKLAMIEDLQTKYTQVLAIGQGDYGIASLYRIGLLFQTLAQELFALPCPKALTEDQCMIYTAALQEQAFPLEEKSVDAFDKAMGKAYELGLYNEWLAKAQEAMKAYEPGRFPEIHNYDLIASEAAFEVPTLVKR